MFLLLSILRKRFLLVICSICFCILNTALVLFWNAQLSNIINMVRLGTPLPHHIIMKALITICGISTLSCFKSILSGLTCESMVHDIRMNYASYFSSLPFAEIERMNAGEQLSVLQNEVNGISEYLNNNLFQLLDDGIRFILTFSWLLFLNPRLTLLSNLPVFLILAYVFYSSKIIGKATEQSQQSKAKMNGYADTLLLLFPIVRLYDASKMLRDEYNKNVENWTYQTIRAERKRAILMSLSGPLTCIPLILLFLVGGRMVINATLTIGTLYIYFNLSGNVSGIMLNMPGYIGAFRQFLGNIKHLTYKILSEGK